ncbi:MULTISPECIES: Tfp pilus assembly protein FimT/FimU [unclassified Psychrobacter]|uniref:pilus assembly FimT family protein n=1 Tax=unclassified Psychrobacter TaxID=196806 RepID=UPI0025E90B61|nr:MULTISPECIES: prepilin-type N-terminal cleavage/methylation domain-containing protein [unclassified Psychrobacter]
MKVSENNVAKKLRMASSGFTLIELMVTIAVLAIIVSIAAPNISTQLANQRVKSTTAILENALKEARAESLIRRQDIKVGIDDNEHMIKIELKDTSSTIVASYSYNTKSTITGNDVEFQSYKIANEETITICDSNLAAATRQVMVSAIGQVTSQLGGTC